MANSSALIYSLKTNRWTTNYVAPDSSISHTTSSTASATASSSHTTIIVGCIIGVLLVIPVGVGLIMYRRRKSLKNADDTVSLADRKIDSICPGKDNGSPQPTPRNPAYHPVVSKSGPTEYSQYNAANGPATAAESSGYGNNGLSPTRYSVQKGYYEARPPPQSPHTIIEEPAFSNAYFKKV